MSVRNRNAYANRRSANSGGVNAVRSVLVILVLAMLSFALGFFVLARLLPDSRLPASGGSAAAISPSENKENADAAEAPPVHTVRKPVTPPKEIAAAPVAKAKPAEETDGPLIEADEANAAPKPDNADAQNPKPAVTRKPAVPDATGETVQTPQQPDGTPPVAGDTPEPKKPKRYTIQINLYSTREAAETEAQQILDRGIKTRVKSITRGGKTYYRVQYRGTFRDKSSADVALATLKEQGVEGVIVTGL